MTPVRQIVDRIRDLPGCVVAPARGLPALRDGDVLPAELRDFYVICGGVTLFRDGPVSIEIVAPERLVRSNPEIVGSECPDDITDCWYIVGREADGPLISIDCGVDRLGRCYDSFWDCHGVAGSCAVVALSFAELLRRLVDSQGRDHYWLIGSGAGHGDAYAPVTP